MSQHAIEDLVETTIYLIDRSALDPARQAALIHGLLDLQARYDTSLTWFRMTEVLLRQGVLLRTRLDALADATLRARADAADWPGWIEHEGDPLYLEWEDDARVLYRQTAPETALPLPVLLHDVLALADQADDGALFADWYALLVNGWLEDVFGAEDGIAISLEGLLASDTLQAIRTLAARRGLERRRGVPEALTLPRLADAGDRDDVERSAGLRFFLEPKRRPSALRAARDKALAQQARVRELIPALVAQRLDGPLLRLGWMPVTAAPAPRRHWIRERDGDHHALWVHHEPALGVLMVQVGVQHAKLLAWQQRVATTQLHDLQFQDSAVGFLDRSLLAGENIGAFGGWVLDPASDDAHLCAALDRLAAALPALDANYFGFVARQFPDAFFARDIDTLLHLLEEGDDTGTIPPEVLFDSPDSLLLAFVFHRLAQGDAAGAASMVERLRARHVALTRLNAWQRRYLAPFLQQWDAGKRDMPMPPVLHPLLAGHLRAQEAD
jgi:hypothetical protein